MGSIGDAWIGDAWPGHRAGVTWQVELVAQQ
jgi:hypothetical protein